MNNKKRRAYPEVYPKRTPQDLCRARERPVLIDKTLKWPGQAAEAKATGEAIAKHAEAIQRLESRESDTTAIENAVEAYLDANPVQPGATDEQAAQINQNTERIDALETGSGGLSDSVKTALLACFEHTAWVDSDGLTYYNELSEALNEV